MSRGDKGFTLIELLVVVAIMSVLIALLLPAVQFTRESARKVQCKSNIKQMGLALQNFHSSYGAFPAGKLDLNTVGHSWCTYLLPFMEQAPLASLIDISKPWNDPGGNEEAALNSLNIFLCPTSTLQFRGGIDYCGITGGTQGNLPLGDGRAEALGSGVLVTVDDANPTFISFRDITDGSSNTICVSESAGRNDETGRWASGNNLVATDVNPINTPGKISSFHTQGVHALRADGSGTFISAHIDIGVLGAISTRNGGEITGEY